MLEVGDKAPNFTLENQDGTKISLDQFLGQKILLWFYPKSSTPG